jgi:DNA-binding NarL/FixJ family response regulator
VLKRKQRRAEVPLDDVVEGSTGGSESAISGVLLEEITDLVGQTDRRILRLIKEGYSSREIAAKLHLSKDSVRKRWERAKNKIRRGLE